MWPLRLVLLLVGAAFASTAAAAPRVGALVPTVRPPPAAEVRDKLHDAVIRGIEAAGLDSQSGAETRIRFGASEELMSCSAPGPCAARASQALSADRVVASEVVVAGKDYVFRLKLLDPAGREVAHVEEPCDICNLREAEEALTAAATKLITTNKAGITEAPRPAAPPAPAPAEPAPVAPPRSEPTPAPAAATTPTAKPDKKPFPWRWVAIGSLAVGVVGLAVGIPLVVIDGQPTCNPGNGLDPRRNCPEVYDTVGGGGTMLAFGVAGLAAAGVLFYFDWRSRHPKGAKPAKPETPAQKTAGFSLMPLRGGGGASFSLKF
jgi:hypothetical protein